MDEEKVEAIKTWPKPTTIKELQRFLGFSNFYRRFIHSYSSITAPLTNLLKGKPKSLSWTPEATIAMKTLQQAFTSAPLLVHPDPQKPFIVEVDASTSGVGAVLSQQQGNPPRLHPCCLFSPGNYPWRSKIMTLGIENFLPSSSPLRNGDTGWRGPAIHLWFTLTTEI